MRECGLDDGDRPDRLQVANQSLRLNVI